MSQTLDFTTRVRFNWGFHDAQLACTEHWPNRLLPDDGSKKWHPMPDDPNGYVAGYAAGQAAFARDGVRSELSDSAWQSSGLADV